MYFPLLDDPLVEVEYIPQDGDNLDFLTQPSTAQDPTPGPSHAKDRRQPRKVAGQRCPHGWQATGPRMKPKGKSKSKSKGKKPMKLSKTQIAKGLREYEDSDDFQ